MIEQPTLAAVLIRFRLQMAARLGADPEAILAAAKLDPALLEDPDRRIGVAQERAVWRVIVQATGRPDIGLICGENLPIQITSMIGYTMMNAPSLWVAGQKMQAYQRIMGNSMGMEFVETGELAHIKVVMWSDWHEEMRHTMDLIMAAIFHWIRSNSALQVKPLAVGFSYPRPANDAIYTQFFSPVPVTFSCPESYLLYRRRELDAPVLAANPQLFTVFNQQVKELYAKFTAEQPYTWRVRQAILELLQGQTPGIGEVAARLTVSTRKLQALLKEEGASFQHLLNEVRRDLSIQYLQEKQASKSEIAYLLGFAEVSVFSHTFKKWTGLSPSEFQAKNASRS